MRLVFISLFTIFIATGFSQKLPKESWKIVFVDSEEKNEQIPGSGLASSVIDGNISSFWTTKIGQGIASFPHSFVVDFGAIIKAKTFYIYPRQNRTVGKIDSYNIYVGLQPNQLKLVYSGKMNFKSLNDWKPRAIHLSSSVQARYLKFEALKPIVETDDCIHLAEIDVVGTYISPLIYPRIAASSRFANKLNPISFADSTKCWNTEVVAWEWKFPGGTPAQSYERNPKILYQNYGKYPVSLTVTTKQGVKRTVVDKSMIAVLPAPEFPRNNWMLSVSDEEIKNKETAPKMMDNNPKTHWHTSWFGAKKLPHFIRIDLGYAYEISGIGYLPRQVGSTNGIFSSYRVYISNDTSSLGKLVTNVKEDKVYRTMRYIDFKPITGRYVKIVIDKTFPFGVNHASASEIYVYAKKESTVSHIWVMVLLALIILAALFWWFKRKKRNIVVEQLSTKSTDVGTTKNVNIYLFGKFQIINHHQPIEQLFNKIKQIFAVIAYHTIENEGINTAEFSRMMWPDLPEENVSSARSSNIKKLRFALESVTCLKIVITKKNWSLESNEEEVFIDYKVYRELAVGLQQMLDNHKLDETLLCSYLSIVERGRFLEEFEVEWADILKNEISEEIILLLKNTITLFSIQMPTKLRLRIADALFIHDELNVDALRLKLQLYQEESNLSLAKKLYDTYARKHKMIYNEEYSTAFNDLIQS